MRSMVEGFFEVGKAPPPPFGWSPSPANAGEDCKTATQVPANSWTIDIGSRS
jgi:hypothetical protein